MEQQKSVMTRREWIAQKEDTVRRMVGSLGKTFARQYREQFGEDEVIEIEIKVGFGRDALNLAAFRDEENVRT